MGRRTYYWTCSWCNANLDPGERCDCNQTSDDDMNYPDVKIPFSKKEGGEKDDKGTPVDGGQHK